MWGRRDTATTHTLSVWEFDRGTAFAQASAVATAAGVVCGTSFDVPPEGQALEAKVEVLPIIPFLYHHSVRACGTGCAH